MRLLELFSGTGSVGTVFKEYGWEVVSLDRDMPADISCDIMDWDYRNSPYPLKHFDVIWASPPCTEYSKAKTRGVRKLDEANAVVERTLEIFGHFQPSIYFLENPQTGLLKIPALHGRAPLQRCGLLQVWYALPKADSPVEQLPPLPTEDLQERLRRHGRDQEEA